MLCEQGIKKSQISHITNRPSLQTPGKYITRPEDASRLQMLPQLPPTVGDENIVTAMDIFSRYSFAYPKTSEVAKTVNRVIIKIKNKHTYLLTTIISDDRSAFVSQVIREFADVLGNTLEHVTTKIAEMIGILGKTHT